MATRDPVHDYLSLIEAPRPPRGNGRPKTAPKTTDMGAGGAPKIDLQMLRMQWLRELRSLQAPAMRAQPVPHAPPPREPPASSPMLTARPPSTPAVPGTPMRRRSMSPGSVVSSGYGPVNFRRRSVAVDETPKKKRPLEISPLQPPLDPNRREVKPTDKLDAWRQLQRQELERAEAERREREARKSSGYGRRTPPPEPESDDELTASPDGAPSESVPPETARSWQPPHPPSRHRSRVPSPRAIAQFAASLDAEPRILIGGHPPEHPLKYCTCCRLAAAPPVLPFKRKAKAPKADPKRAQRLAAALIVQVCLQSWAARRAFERMRLHRRRETAAASVVRRWWRFHFVCNVFYRYERHFRIIRRAAAVIQRAWRRHRRKQFRYLMKARGAVVRIMRWFRRRQAIRQRQKAARSIQRFRRRFVILRRWQRAAYRMLYRAQQAAIRMQAAFRMSRCRRPLLERIKARKAAQRNGAALNIQMAYRRHRVERRVAKRRYRAARSAWRWRGAQRANRFRRAVEGAARDANLAATVIQACQRRHRAWRAMQQLAAARIQAVQRAHRAAKLLHHTRWSARKIQRLWRRIVSRDALNRARDDMRRWVDSVRGTCVEAAFAVERVEDQSPPFFATPPNSPLRLVDRWRVLQALVAHRRHIRALFLAAAMDGANAGAAASGARIFALSPRRFIKLIMETIGIPLPRANVASLFIVVNREGPPTPAQRPHSPARAPTPSRALSPVPSAPASAANSPARLGAAGSGARADRPPSASRLAPPAAERPAPPSARAAPPAPPGGGGADGDSGSTSVNEFAEALLRASAMLYPYPIPGVKPGTSEAGARVRRLLSEYVAPAGEKALRAMPLRLDLANSTVFVSSVLKRNERELKALFTQYARSTDDRNDAAAEQLNWREFLALLQGRSMIGASLSTLAAFRAFVYANAGEITSFLDERPDGARLDSLLQMDYGEFLEALCRCCARASASNANSVDNTLAVPIRELEPFLRRLLPQA